MAASRGIDGLGGGRRRPPLDTFKRLYSGSPAFSGLFDLAILGGIALLFLDPHAFVAPFEWVTRLLPTRTASAPPVPSPAPSPSPAPPPAPAPVGQGGGSPPSPAPSGRPDAPGAGGGTPAPAPAGQGTPAPVPVVAQTPWPEAPLVSAPTPGLVDFPIPFPSDILGAQRPNVRWLVIDDRSFSTLPPDLKAKVDTALTARYEQRWDDLLAGLAGADPTSGPVRLLTGLAIASKGEPGWPAKAEEQLRAALAAAEPQAATVLGALLTGNVRGLAGTSEEGKAMLAAAARSGERAARLIVGLGFLNGQDGTVDPPKAVELIRSAALAGEPLALLHYARLLQEGIGGTKDPALAEAALRRAASLGLTEAKTILGRWIVNAYLAGKITDPKDGVAALEEATARHDMPAANSLGSFFNNQARALPWIDPTRGLAVLTECGRFKVNYCHNNLGLAYQFSRGTVRDVVAAWAHYDIGRQLNPGAVMQQMGPLDSSMLPDEKTRARALSQTISAALLPIPPVVALQRPR